MNRRVLSIGFLALGVCAQGQETFLVNFDSIQNGHPGAAFSVKEVPNGYLAFGQQQSNDGTDKVHVFVRKLSSQGNLVQELEYFPGDTFNLEILSIDPIAAVDPAFSFLGVVTKLSEETPERALSLFKFDSQGDTLFTQEFMHYPPIDSTVLTARQIHALSSGGYAMVGAIDPIDIRAKALLVRLGPDGDTLWTRTYGNDSTLNEAYGFVEYYDHGFLITGYRLMSYVQDNSFLIRTDSLGHQTWRREYGNKASVHGAVRMTLDSNIVTWSEYKEEQLPFYWQSMMLTKWDSAGSVIWQRKSHYGYYSGAYDIEVLPDGGFICSGASNYAGVLARFDMNGDSLWSRSFEAFDGDDPDFLMDVTPTSDGGYILCGVGYQDWDDPHPGLATTYVVKTDSFGCVVPGCQNVGVQEYELGLQDRLHVAPNPANERVSLELELPAEYVLNGPVSVIVFDATGREVLRESVGHNGVLLSHTLHVAGWPPGLYHLHLADQCKWLAGAKVVVE